MKRFLPLIVLLAASSLAHGAAPVVTNIANFPSVSVAYTNYVSELLVTNGITLNGVRNTSWPAGGIANTVVNSGVPANTSIPIYNGTTGTNVTPSGLTVSSLTNLTAGVVTSASINTPILQVGSLAVSNLTTGFLYYNNSVTNAPYTPLSGTNALLVGTATITNTAITEDSLALNQFTAGTNAFIRARAGGTQQFAIYGDGADSLALRNGTNSQTLSVYKTDGANYERLTASYDSVNVSFLIAPAKAGSGTLRPLSLDGSTLNFKSAGSYRWNVNGSGHLAPILDNTFTVGDATHRPSSIYGFGFASYGTNTVMVTSATGCTNTTAMNQIAYVTAATGAALTDAAGTTEFSGVTIAAFTPIRLQPGGKFTGTSITYATGTSSHAW